MATVFGISGLRSKLDDWRWNRKNAKPRDLADVESDSSGFRGFGSQGEDVDLSLLLENLVIPKLIADRDMRGAKMEFQRLLNAPPQLSRTVITDSDVEDFARLSVSEDANALLDFVEQQLATGSSVETIYVELLAPAARRLGEYWSSDSEDFVGVTMGLWRIQEILRELTTRIPPRSNPGQGQRSALFSSMPGDNHSFGTLMVAECFQRAGWDTDVLIEPTQSELVGKFAKHHYDLIGLTITCDCSTGTLSSLVSAIKAVSSNPHVRIMVGGPVINERPELVDECGADATAIDAVSAVALADRLVPVNVECFDNLT